MKRYMIVALAALLMVGCKGSKSTPTSTTGVKKATARVKTGSDGLTVEQRNIKGRIEAENAPGAIKHLYVISAYSGQVLVYSTVKGKVTSSGKRLTPYSVVAMANTQMGRKFDGIAVDVGGDTHQTGEVLQDDGTYGHSIPYLFWWDTKGLYHQHYVAGGQIIHVADQPLTVKSVVINMELATDE